MPGTDNVNKNSISFDKYGPWAVIAGASEGTGAEFAVQLADAGINLVLVARRPEPLEHLADELRKRNAVSIRTLSLDLSLPDAAETMFAATSDLEVGLYVSNAGTDSAVGPFLDIPLERTLAMINMNIKTVTLACHGFLRPMRKRGRGGIVLMSSVSGLVGGQPGFAIYSASKAYDLSFAESLWSELRTDNVDVIGIGAPPMATPPVLRSLEQAGIKWDKLYKPADVVRTSLAMLGKAPSYIFDFVDVDTEPGEVTAAARHARTRAVESMFQKVFASNK